MVDIGGTTTDVGYLLKNGYPRLSKTYTSLAGVKVNLENAIELRASGWAVARCCMRRKMVAFFRPQQCGT